MELQTHGTKTYPTSALLGSTAGLGWSTLSAELRSHGVCKTPLTIPQHMEVCLALAGTTKGPVRRIGAGQCQEAMPTTGAIWLSPIGVEDREITITAPIPKAMHLYLPAALFQFPTFKRRFKIPRAAAHSIQYIAGIRDEVIHQIALSLASEITNGTAAGRIYAETASLALPSRLLRKYCDSGACAPNAPDSHLLENIRPHRVLDYISANIWDDISLADLAGSRVIVRFTLRASSHAPWVSRPTAI
jgi:AraC family transcriptional regulator